MSKKSDQQWKRELSPEQYAILRQKGTEPAFTGVYVDHKEKGIFQCAGCAAELFSSSSKFDSGTGWPSFWAPVRPECVHCETDLNYGMIRTEILCAACGSHLGHVFDDGPAPTGRRYCVNSVTMKFVPEKNQGYFSSQIT